MESRIGINLGDVIEDEDRVYGDGVNIAARIEGLAEPGGICISGSGFEQVKGKLKVGYEYLGEQSVKNIGEKVRAYRVLMEPEAAGSVIYRHRKDDPRPKRSMTISALLILIAGASAIGAGTSIFVLHQLSWPPWRRWLSLCRTNRLSLFFPL